MGEYKSIFDDFFFKLLQEIVKWKLSPVFFKFNLSFFSKTIQFDFKRKLNEILSLKESRFNRFLDVHTLFFPKNWGYCAKSLENWLIYVNNRLN